MPRRKPLKKSGCNFVTGLFSCFPPRWDHVRRVRRELLLHNDHSKSIHGQRGLATAQGKKTHPPIRIHGEHLKKKKKKNYNTALAYRHHSEYFEGCDFVCTEAVGVPIQHRVNDQQQQLFINASMTGQENTTGTLNLHFHRRQQ